MTICLCIKADGLRCTRKASNKLGANQKFCWQHQKCANITKVAVHIPDDKIIKKDFIEHLTTNNIDDDEMAVKLRINTDPTLYKSKWQYKGLIRKALDKLSLKEIVNMFPNDYDEYMKD